jgi:hypothetical protein
MSGANAAGIGVGKALTGWGAVFLVQTKWPTNITDG